MPLSESADTNFSTCTSAVVALKIWGWGEIAGAVRRFTSLRLLIAYTFLPRPGMYPPGSHQIAHLVFPTDVSSELVFRSEILVSYMVVEWENDDGG